MISLRNKFIVLFYLLFISCTAYSSEFTIGGNYRFSGQNIFNKNPAIDFGLGLSSSIFFKETHEIGIKTAYNANWEKITVKDIGSKVSSFSSTIYYNYHFYLTGSEASFPVTIYFGPGFGLSEITSPARHSKIELLAEATIGSNIFITSKIALDIQLLSISRMITTKSPTLYQQFIGFKFFF